jgi:DNA polymerase III delta' subunit
LAFKDITGHERVKSILRRALGRGRLPNSLLFAGPSGVGKKDTALVVAKALNCLNREDDACEECSFCRAVNHGSAPDVLEISPERSVLKIDRMRLLKEAAYLKPMTGRKRVFLIVDADKMNREAANSLLKVLEEPPLFSHIILLTENPFVLLPTIRSRCQLLSFASISREDIENRLVDRGTPREQARTLALLARGNLKQAMELEWDDALEKRREAWDLFGALLEGKEAAGFLREYSGKPRRRIQEELAPQLEIAASFARDLLLLSDEGETRFLLNPDFETPLRELNRRRGREAAFGVLDRIDDCLLGLDLNLNIRVLIGSLSFPPMDGHHA